MRFELNHARCCVSELRKGEAKRIPKNALQKPVGFYVGCPSCGFPQAITSRAVDDRHGQDFEEGPDGLTMTPGYACEKCARVFRVDRGEIVFA